MAHISSTASYKRREIAGQLLLDFSGALPSSGKTASLEPPRASASDRMGERHAKDSDFPAEIEALARGPECSESSAAKVDDAPEFKLSGKRGFEIYPAFPNEINRLAASASVESCPANAFTTDARAVALIQQAAREVRPGEVRAVRVRFFPFRATLYSFKMDKTRTAIVKFHVSFRRAGDAVILQAARLMLCRARKIRQTLHRDEYDRFVRSLPPGEFKLPGARPPKKMAFGSKGVCRHLDECFKRVNDLYFASQLKQPELCWSPVRARRILGSYQERSDRLIVSRVFDSPSVPLFVLDFLMYHELLHKFLGVGRRGDGRRCMHGAEFKELERKFTRFEEAQEFIKRL